MFTKTSLRAVRWKPLYRLERYFFPLWATCPQKDGVLVRLASEYEPVLSLVAEHHSENKTTIHILTSANIVPGRLH